MASTKWLTNEEHKDFDECVLEIRKYGNEGPMYGFVKELINRIAASKACAAEGQETIDKLDEWKTQLADDGLAKDERIAVLEAELRGRESATKDYRNRIAILETGLRYLSQEKNWDKHEEDEDYIRLVRPGGGRQEGVILYSRHIVPWGRGVRALTGSCNAVCRICGDTGEVLNGKWFQLCPKCSREPENTGDKKDVDSPGDS